VTDQQGRVPLIAWEDGRAAHIPDLAAAVAGRGVQRHPGRRRAQRTARLGVRIPRQRKEPLTSASHVRSALSRFDQVQDVTDADRALAFENIRRAASYYRVDMTERSWHDLMH
jgi:hypothetical protein